MVRATRSSSLPSTMRMKRNSSSSMSPSRRSPRTAAEHGRRVAIEAFRRAEPPERPFVQQHHPVPPGSRGRREARDIGCKFLARAALQHEIDAGRAPAPTACGPVVAGLSLASWERALRGSPSPRQGLWSRPGARRSPGARRQCSRHVPPRPRRWRRRNPLRARAPNHLLPFSPSRRARRRRSLQPGARCRRSRSRPSAPGPAA